MSANPLIISKCIKCQKTAWPLQKYCSDCFGKTESIQASKTGVIIEFSKKDNVFFCITEFDGIRLVCTLQSDVPPRAGQTVTFVDHQITDGKNIFRIVSE